jgi:hypothetical protein
MADLPENPADDPRAEPIFDALVEANERTGISHVAVVRSDWTYTLHPAHEAPPFRSDHLRFRVAPRAAQLENES